MPSVPVPLSQESEDQIASAFDTASVQRVKAALEDYGVESWHREIERVRFDIVFLAQGSAEEVVRLVCLACRDYRNVLSREYDARNGHTPRAWAMRHGVNQRRSEDAALERSLRQAERGDLIDHDDVKRRLSERLAKPEQQP